MPELRAPGRSDPHVNCSLCKRVCHPLVNVNREVAALPFPECPDFVAVMVGVATWICASCTWKATGYFAKGIRGGRKPPSPRLKHA